MDHRATRTSDRLHPSHARLVLKHTFPLHLKETEWRYNHRRADKYKCLLQYLRKNPLS